MKSKQELLKAEFLNSFVIGPVTSIDHGTVTLLDSPPVAVAETWTLVCTISATNNSTFSVTGSIQGALANLTSDIPYDNTFISLTLTDGQDGWEVGDTVTIEVIRTVVITEVKKINEWDSIRVSQLQIDMNGGGTPSVIDFELVGSIIENGIDRLYHSKVLTAEELAAMGSLYTLPDSPKVAQTKIKVNELNGTGSGTIVITGIIEQHQN